VSWQDGKSVPTGILSGCAAARIAVQDYAVREDGMAKHRPRPSRQPDDDQAELHEPTEAELDERVSVYPLDAEEALRALVRSAGKKRRE